MREFRSILRDEMNGYITLCESEGKSIKSIESGIFNLDMFLDGIGHETKDLTADLLAGWIGQLHPLKKVTVKWHVIVARQFFSYLRSLGMEVSVPEVPAYRSDYIPYAFSDQEIARLIAAADTLPFIRKNGGESAIQFSVYLRILYGCGLRAGEALKLRRCDIDFNYGVITVRCAKRKKDRLVPMKDSLTQLLAAYSSQLADSGACGYLFPRRNDQPRDAGWAYAWFRRTLIQAGIVYEKEKNERAGPCPYSLRHAFIHRAYRQYADTTGHSFDDIMPFLSAYVGHEKADGTDRYFRYDSSLFPMDNEAMDSLVDSLLPED